METQCVCLCMFIVLKFSKICSKNVLWTTTVNTEWKHGTHVATEEIECDTSVEYESVFVQLR